MTRNRAERRHHMVRLKKSAVVIALQAMEAKSIRYLLSYSCICSFVGCVGIDAIIMVPAYRKFVQKHAMRIKGK